MLKNKKILAVLTIVLVIIIAGIAVLFTKGMNYSLAYGNNTTIELYLETDFEDADVQNIIKEVFGNKIETRQVNNLKHDILIITESASDEQLDNLVSKVNEKYELELKKDSLLVTNNVEINGMDLISPYILPVAITTVAILAYFIIRYKKLGIYNISLVTILTIILTQLLVLSIYTIARLQINEYAMPISMIVYLISVILLTEKFENDLNKIKKQEQ